MSGFEVVAVDLYHAAVSYSGTGPGKFQIEYVVLVSADDSAFNANDFTANLVSADDGKQMTLSPAEFSKKKELGCYDEVLFYEFRYRSNLDLNNTEFVDFKNKCRLRFDMKICCVNSNAFNTTANAVQNIYVYTERNTCDGGQDIYSPRPDPFAFKYMGFGMELYPFLNAQDAVEYDEVRCYFAMPMDAPSSVIALRSGFAFDQPIQTNSNSFKLDSATGNIYAEPSTCGDLGMVFFSLKQFQNFSNKDVEISDSRIFYKLKVQEFSGNNAPEFIDANDVEVCAGDEVVLVIKTDDKVKIPVPPQKTPPADSISLKWNRGIPDAVFTIMNPDSQFQTGRLVWQTQVSDARKKPYAFTVTARDNHCPFNLTSTKTISIHVNPYPVASREIRHTADSGIAIRINEKDSFHFFNTVTISFLQNGKIIKSTDSIEFASNHSYESNNVKDYVTTKFPGKYVMQTVVENEPNCLAVYTDTVELFSIGIREIQNAQFSVYPNPANESIRISCGSLFNNTNDFTLRIFSTSGALVEEIFLPDLLAPISVSELPSGIYILELNCDGKSGYSRLGVE